MAIEESEFLDLKMGQGGQNQNARNSHSSHWTSWFILLQKQWRMCSSFQQRRLSSSTHSAPGPISTLLPYQKRSGGSISSSKQQTFLSGDPSVFMEAAIHSCLLVQPLQEDGPRYLFFFFFGLLSFQGCIRGIWRSPGQGSNQSCSCWPTPQPQRRGIRAVSTTYTTVQGNTRSFNLLSQNGNSQGTILLCPDIAAVSLVFLFSFSLPPNSLYQPERFLKNTDNTNLCLSPPLGLNSFNGLQSYNIKYLNSLSEFTKDLIQPLPTSLPSSFLQNLTTLFFFVVLGCVIFP